MREHLRRAVRPGVAPIGTELDRPAGLIKLVGVANAQSH
jgi:hypothetical protein